MATSHKFNWDQGTTISRTLQWKRDTAEDGEEPDYQPVDLTGYTARMELRDRVGGTLLHRMDTDGGEIVIEAATGSITFEIPATITEAWSWRNAVYDLELEDSTGRVTRLIQGSISLSPEVTTGD